MVLVKVVIAFSRTVMPFVTDNGKPVRAGAVGKRVPIWVLRDVSWVPNWVSSEFS